MHDYPLTESPPEHHANGPLLTPEERTAAFAGGAPRIPRRAVVSLVSACLVLGLGGIVIDHFFGGASAAAPSKTALAGAPLRVRTTSRAVVSSRAVTMMGLQVVDARPAPLFSLVDDAGKPLGLSQLRGSVVVLSFFDSRCDDICPVLATELRMARADLGGKAGRVAFVTVNTDPLATSRSSLGPAQRVALPASDRWFFLTASLGKLDRVWRSYGVTIDAQPTTGRVSHNDVLYFIDPSGRLRARATPFADESATGRFSLASGIEARWGKGIADEARSLLGRRS